MGNVMLNYYVHYGWASVSIVCIPSHLAQIMSFLFEVAQIYPIGHNKIKPYEKKNLNSIQFLMPCANENRIQLKMQLLSN